MRVRSGHGTDLAARMPDHITSCLGESRVSLFWTEASTTMRIQVAAGLTQSWVSLQLRQTSRAVLRQ